LLHETTQAFESNYQKIPKDLQETEKLIEKF